MALALGWPICSSATKKLTPRSASSTAASSTMQKPPMPGSTSDLSASSPVPVAPTRHTYTVHTQLLLQSRQKGTVPMGGGKKREGKGRGGTLALERAACPWLPQSRSWRS